ncbi:TPA: hypothetical protein JBD66_11550 [Legionella pneumophila subsp. pneumophila]|uniref:hypothetical protein n=1 Tax=Legionella pneumophila TaxID=446 RepID=UPI001A1FA620|nr:hypothetical protein [Legionella pneumophila]HAT9067926.1 hypothetical protein [Legionella pneumophila subsp. pneumophila]MDO5215741.1 hypothetical protein [Legionella pneumophila]MDW9186066.1 hypothetical protein [Legionella pneumophila]HAT9082538.1 hypothetical protein [Legionella pneumophila subsp. pneumophila]HAT9110245.1 hypothetical protein [Legionella pneumophila subsp. pneumophila]
MSNNTREVSNSDMLNTVDEMQDKKEYLLSQENFERLMNVQKTVEQATEMRPTFKKLINSLVTEEALNTLTERLIKQMA